MTPMIQQRDILRHRITDYTHFRRRFLASGNFRLHLVMVHNSNVVSRGRASNAGYAQGAMNADAWLERNDIVYIRSYIFTNDRIYGPWSYFTGHLLSRNV